MSANSIFGTKKLVPVVDFKALADTDFGLIKLIQSEYLDPSYFDIEKFKKSDKELLYELYTRKVYNPLLLYVNDNINEKECRELYINFFTEKYNDILDNSVATELLTSINLFKTSGEIDPIILCQDSREIDKIRNTEILKGINTIFLADLEDNTNKYDIYFLKELVDIELFEKQKSTTFYISTFGPNLTEDNKDLIQDELLSKLSLEQKCQVNLFDMYKLDLLKG